MLASGQLIPSLSILGGQPYGFRFALQQGVAVVSLDTVGAIDISLPEMAAVLGVPTINEDDNLDFYDLLLPPQPSSRGLSTGSSLPAGQLWIFLKLTPENTPADLSLMLVVTLSEPKPIDNCAQGQARGDGSSLSIPPISQMEQSPDIARHICSPVNTAMVAGYLLGQPVPLGPVIASARSARRGMFGIWPNAIRAAALQGLPGMVTALAGWDDVAALLQAGLPVIATVAYGPGELAGAAVAATKGHLVTITGLKSGKVVVNDPAAANAAAVCREYDRDEFARAWFGNKQGVAYVLWK